MGHDQEDTQIIMMPSKRRGGGGSWSECEREGPGRSGRGGGTALCVVSESPSK